MREEGDLVELGALSWVIADLAVVNQDNALTMDRITGIRPYTVPYPHKLYLRCKNPNGLPIQLYFGIGRNVPGYADTSL